MITVFVEAYNKTIDALFRLSDWLKNRDKNKLADRRKKLEEMSRKAQIDGDLNELRRVRAEIEELDRVIGDVSNK